MVPSKCLYLSQASKIKFLKNVDRSSHGAKLIGMINRISFFETEMFHNHTVIEMNAKLFKVIGRYFNKSLEISVLLLCAVINILLLMDMQITVDTPDRLYNGTYDGTITVISIINMCLSLVGFFTWFFTQNRLIRIINQKEYLDEHSTKQQLNFFDKIYINLYKSLLSQGDASVFMIHIVSSLLGIFVSQGFYGFQLLTVVNLSDTLQLLVKSTTSHSKQLGATYILGIVTMYSYALFSHAYFIRGFGAYADSDVMRKPANTVDTKCDSLIHCFFSVINEAFSNNQGIGLLMKPESFSPQNYKFYLL